MASCTGCSSKESLKLYSVSLASVKLYYCEGCAPFRDCGLCFGSGKMAKRIKKEIVYVPCEKGCRS